MQPLIDNRRLWAVVLFVILLLLGVSLRWGVVGSYVYSNTAVTFLNKSHCDFSGSCLNDELGTRLTRFFKKSLTLNTERRDEWRWLAIILRGSGQDEAALTAWQQADIVPGDLLWWGRQAFGAQQFDQALRWFDTAVQLQPNSSDGWYESGMAYLKLEDWQAAASAFQQSVAMDNFHTVPKSSGFYRLGLIFHRYPALRQPDSAFAAYDAALYWDDFRNFQDKADSYYGRADLYRENGRFEEAVSDYQQAISINPQHEWAYLGLALAQYAMDGNLNQAEHILGQGISIWPEGLSKKWPYRSLGELYQQAGQTGAAIDAFQQALEYDPDDASVRAQLNAILDENP